MEEYCGNVQQESYFLWECIYFEEEPGVKHIYQMIDHKLSLFLECIFWHVANTFYSAVGAPPPRYVPFRAVFTISNSTPFTYRRNFALKLSVQSYENMFLLSFLSVTIYGFFLFSKAKNEIE